MTTKKFNYQPLYPGFDWGVTLNVTADPILFPAGSKFRAQIRTEEGGRVLATLTTDAGQLNRIDDNRLAIAISGAVSAKWDDQPIMLDLVRADVSPAKHLGIRITIITKISLTGH